MEFLKPGPELAPYELRAMTMVTRAAESGLAQPQRAMLDAAQRIVLETDLDVETLPPITSDELASYIDDEAQARQLVRLMVATSLADGPPSMEQVSLMASFAAALGVEEPSVGVVRHLAKKRLLMFRLAFMRHSHVRTYLRNTYRLLGGILPVIKAILRFRGVIKGNPELAARFHALEKLPEDTLGHRFFRHCTDEGLAFPGEKGGFPVGALFHDFSHVLACVQLGLKTGVRTGGVVLAGQQVERVDQRLWHIPPPEIAKPSRRVGNLCRRLAWGCRHEILWVKLQILDCRQPAVKPAIHADCRESALADIVPMP